VEVTARDLVTNALIADGVVRFKLNPVVITDLKAENPQSPGDNTFFPMESVEITGGLKDNSSPPALANRPVEDVIVDVTVTRPDGSSASYEVTSCVDTDPTPADQCGGNIFRSQPDGHGKFMVTFGGPQGVFINTGIPGILTTTGPKSTTCNDICIDALFSMTDTLDTGTYDVFAEIRGYNPTVSATATFDVILL
ncbi:MAG: hypothetical protein ACRDKS_13560, partial [Actinomycetota bacterium]